MKNLKMLSLIITLLAVIVGVQAQNSQGIYRLPYANGTQVRITGDHQSHNPPNRIDMVGINGEGNYRIVSAAAGVVRFVVDQNTQVCCGGNCGNNYVWIEHDNGEWTKYSHLATNSASGTAGLRVGQRVGRGQFLGFESNIGRACGRHLHFEVAVPTNPNNPLQAGNGGFIRGTNRIPRFCNIGIVEDNRTYTASACGTIGRKVKGYKWSEGWTTVEFFKQGSQTYVFLMKEKGFSSSGHNVHINKVNSNGTIGSKVKGYKWSEGWTTAQFYKRGSQMYLFLLKKNGVSSHGHNVHINKVNSNGTIGSKVKGYKWSGGWTTAEFYKQGSKTYLFLMKASGTSSHGHNVHINLVNSNGTIGSKVKGYKWSSGWTTAQFYKRGSQMYLFLLKKNGVSSSGHNVHINKVNSNGMIGSKVKGYKWSSGWTTAEFYKRGNTTYLFLMKASGTSSHGHNVHINRVNSNGTIGQKIIGYKWSSGWTSAEFYQRGSQLYLFLLKKSGVSSHGHNVHINKVDK